MNNMNHLDILREKFDPRHRDILTDIWRYHLKDGHWIPTRFLHVTHGNKKIVRPILEQFGGSVVYEQVENNNSYYGLMFLGVLVCSDGERVEELVANYLRVAQTLALQEPKRTHISSEEALKHLRLTPERVMELGRILVLSPLRSDCSINSSGWNAGLPKEIEDLPDDLHAYISDRAMERYNPDMPVDPSERQAYLARNKITTSLSGTLLRTSTYASVDYVDPARIAQLGIIRSEKYDLTRLIELCRELNVCYDNESYLAVAVLTRALLDHVPPIFGVTTFSEVANNYKGSRSFREAMSHLDTSCRKIADAHLHVQIRRKEVLPTKTQVNFASDLDLLLAEIVTLLG
jgi:hypothetical protein